MLLNPISQSRYVVADRLQIHGQAERELVLSRLYLLHASAANVNCQEVDSGGSVSMPTVVRATARDRADSNSPSEQLDDVAG